MHREIEEGTTLKGQSKCRCSLGFEVLLPPKIIRLSFGQHMEKERVRASFVSMVS